MEYMKEKSSKERNIEKNNSFYKLDKFYAKEGCFHLCSISEKQNYGKDTGSH